MSRGQKSATCCSWVVVTTALVPREELRPVASPHHRPWWAVGEGEAGEAGGGGGRSYSSGTAELPGPALTYSQEPPESRLRGGRPGLESTSSCHHRATCRHYLDLIRTATFPQGYSGCALAFRLSLCKHSPAPSPPRACPWGQGLGSVTGGKQRPRDFSSRASDGQARTP